jgi:hypothetical protein
MTLPLKESKAVWSAKLQNIRDLEAELNKRQKTIDSTVPPLSAQISALDKKLANLSPAAFALLITAASSAENQEAILTAESREILQSITAWYAVSAGFQDLLNQKIIAKQLYVVERTMAHAAAGLKEPPLYGDSHAATLYGKLSAQFDRYKANYDKIGDVNPKEQRERLYAFYEFFKLAEKFFALSRHNATATAPSTLKKGGFSSSQLLKLAGIIAKKTSSTKIYFLVKYYCDRLCHANAYKIAITGQEHLEHLSARKSKGSPSPVYLYAPSHRTNVADLILISRLKFPDVIIFLNGRVVAEFVSTKYVRKIAAWIGDRKGIVPVGDLRGSKQKYPGPRLLESLAAKVSTHIINYPQGFTALLGEILPTNRNFTAKLIVPVLRAHYPLQIIPITFDIDSAFMQGDWQALAKGCTVKAHPALSTRLLTLIVALEQNSSQKFKHLFSLILRSFWLDHTTEFPELTLEQINDKLQQKLGINILQ